MALFTYLNPLLQEWEEIEVPEGEYYFDEVSSSWFIFIGNNVLPFEARKQPDLIRTSFLHGEETVVYWEVPFWYQGNGFAPALPIPLLSEDPEEFKVALDLIYSNPEFDLEGSICSLTELGKMRNPATGRWMWTLTMFDSENFTEYWFDYQTKKLLVSFYEFQEELGRIEQLQATIKTGCCCSLIN